MKINDLMSGVDMLKSFNCSNNIDILEVEYDSRDVLKGFLFVAIKGPQDDGNLFIIEAKSS